MGDAQCNQQRTAPWQIAIRLVLLLGLAWLAVMTTMSIKTLLSPPPASRAELPTIDDSFLMPISGAWRFDDSQTTISSTMSETLNLSSAKKDDDKTFLIDEPALKAFVELDANSEVSTATLAMQLEDKWQILKLGNTDTQHASPHLLPLGKSKRVCGRWSDDDRLLLEIVSVDADGRELLEAWRQAGWEIRHTAWGSLDSFSYLCVKGGRIVYAWSKQSDRISSLLLSSSSDVALRRPTPKNGNHS